MMLGVLQCACHTSLLPVQASVLYSHVRELAQVLVQWKIKSDMCFAAEDRERDWWASRAKSLMLWEV